MKIALTGFSLSGKTETGKILAEKLGVEFVDSDKVIENSCGNINSIFSKYGEDYFRTIEEKIIKEIVLNKTDFVLSLGGGAALSKSTVKLLKENAVTVWLKTSIENILKRDNNSQTRPLLNGTDRVKTIKELYDKRQRFYSFADIIIITDNKDQNQTAQEILNIIKSD